VAATVAAADQGEVAVQPFAEQGEVQAAVGDFGDRVVALGECPDAPVSHDDIACPVLARGDDAPEVVLVDRVVLDVHRQATHVRVERRSLGDGPLTRTPSAVKRNS
jgi:hypothetical protein